MFIMLPIEHFVLVIYDIDYFKFIKKIKILPKCVGIG